MPTLTHTPALANPNTPSTLANTPAEISVPALTAPLPPAPSLLLLMLRRGESGRGVVREQAPPRVLQRCPRRDAVGVAIGRVRPPHQARGSFITSKHSTEIGARLLAV